MHCRDILADGWLDGAFQNLQALGIYERNHDLKHSTTPSRTMASSSSNQNQNPTPTPNPSTSKTPPPADATPDSSKTPLPLPSPENTTDATKLDINSTIKLDAMGPLVVNKDGTLSRIANWDTMAEIERQNTLRILGKRNMLRREGLEKAQAAREEEGEGAK
ncbi:hypothetical protein J1614_007965 [Plenodomus biglobosus]|nr:hypothetical protein J1614_007965 [Plenodomus biglobosus]